MTIIATCGHEIPDNSELFSATYKDYTREGERCLTTGMLCLKCKSLMMQWGDILDTEEEEQAWLHSGDYHGEGTA